jgi:hypothetical protein
VLGEALIDLMPSGAPGKYQAGVGGSPFNVAVGRPGWETGPR